MVGVLIKAAAMGFFQVLGVLRPRESGKLINRDALLNLANGLILFALKYALVGAVVYGFDFALVDPRLLGSGLAQWFVCLVLLDFLRYWLHYAGHRVPFLWQFHKVHHSAEYLDATTGLRMHPVDFVQLSMLPLLVFGVIFDGRLMEPWVIPAVLVVGDVMDAFEHANLRLNPNNPVFKVWDKLLNSSHFHMWHHTREGQKPELDGNYGNTFVIWDRMFGTDVTKPVPPELYGIEDKQALENTLLGWFLLRRRNPQLDGATPSKAN